MTTALSVAALAIALVAVLYAWRLQRDLVRTTARLDRYNRSLFQANAEIRRLHEQLADVAADVRTAAVLGTGPVVFTASTTVREAQQLHPQSEQILGAFHVGGCSNCAVDPDATIAEVSRERGIEPAALLASLNQLLGPAVRANDVPPTLVKLPNVQVEF